MKILNLEHKPALLATTNKTFTKKSKFAAHLYESKLKQHKAQILKMLDKIQYAANKLKLQITEQSLNEYISLVKEYLSFVLKENYSLKRERSIDYSKIYLRVEIIDKELEQLKNDFFNNQKETIDLSAAIDKITGLLIDIYK
ncbi:YaaR family protein [Peptococcaceae bacterium]|nr:YaaR family protein [Peptococcaceae bacterium]